MKHLHTLLRVKHKSRKDLFMCADPLCMWTRRKEFLLGKKFICPYCGNEYLAKVETFRLKVPHCANCTNTKDKMLKIIDPIVQLVVNKDKRTLSDLIEESIGDRVV